MNFATKSIVARLNILMLLLVLIFTLAACNATGSPDTEGTSFEGAPIVRIAAPITGDTYREGVGVDILVRIENAGADIGRVAIQVDGVNIGEAILPNEAGAPSFTIRNSWTATGVGNHEINVIASRGDTSINASASVTINVVAAPNTQPTTQQVQPQASNTSAAANNNTDNNNSGFTQVTQNPAPTQQAAATNTSAPVDNQAPAASNTPAPPTATPTQSRPTVTVTTGANVRSGPGVVFDPPLGSLAAGATANILAVNPSGTWYKIQFYNGEAWISAQVVTVSGNTSSLPVDAGPATPVPASPTPILPTATPTVQSTVDLIIDGANTAVLPSFRCGQASEIRVTVVNAGTSASPATVVVISDTQPNGSVGATTQGPVPALQPNQSTVVTMYLTVSTFVLEGHTFRAVVDGNNSIPETNEGNNGYEYRYVLESGTC